MSRHGYQDECEIGQNGLAMWRGRVMSAIRGKRGQRLLTELREALDAMPEKRLIRADLIDGDGEVCALGCVGKKRQIPDLDKIDPEDHDRLAKTFDVAACLIQEIEYQNDDGAYTLVSETPEKRWQRMRRWCDENIKAVTP